MARSRPARNARNAKGAKKTPSGWDRLVPFPRGAAFAVKVSRPPLPMRGRGTVLQRSATRLHVEIEVPGLLVFPRVRVEVLLDVRHDGGPGNSGTVHVTVGTRRHLSFTDSDLTVRTSPDGQEREISTSTSHHGFHGTAVIRAEDGLCRVSALGFEAKLRLT